MPHNFILSCCSTADLSHEHLVRRDINCLSFHYSLDGVEYLDDPANRVPMADFYKAMVDGADAKTSQINASEFIENFTPFLEKGLDILHLSLSSGISGVYGSAVEAQKVLAERFPERKIYVVDSLAASAGYGLLMDMLADLRDTGASIDEVRDYAEENKLKLNHWFFSTDLTFFVKGGRVSKAAGWFGTVFKICPLLNVDLNGKLIPRKKVRTKRAVIIETLNKMKELAENGTDYSGKCFISHSECYYDARLLADLIENEFRSLSGKVVITDIGTTIGSHTGPGTVALFFVGRDRRFTE